MDHFALQEYEWGLAQYLGAGVAACYRGYRVYDTDRTESLVKKYVEFYKASVMVRKKIFSMGRPFLSELSLLITSDSDANSFTTQILQGDAIVQNIIGLIAALKISSYSIIPY